jgi:hypothetical protein
MKYKFNIQPIIIEADSEEEAWDKFDRGEYDLLCNDMEELEETSHAN